MNMLVRLPVTRPNGFTSDWTPERERLLVELHNSKKHSAKEIGERLGLTKNSIIGKLYRMGINHDEVQDPWSDPEIEGLKEIWNTGILVREVVNRLFEKFGIQRTTRAVAAKASRLGLARKKKKVWKRQWYHPVYVKKSTLPENFAPLNIRFMEIENIHCREIVGSGEDSLALFCGHDKRKGSSFCEAHHRINYHELTPWNRS